MNPKLAILLLLFAVSADAQPLTTYTRRTVGTTVPYGQVSCTSVSGTLVATNVGAWDRLSILIKYIESSGGAGVYICPGSATCTAATGFELEAREGLWLDWSTNGPISCITAAGTAVVSYIEERG
jgi:hypothetical protein